METKQFNLFDAREAAENYVTNIYEETSTSFSTKNVAVDKDYRCIEVPDSGNIREVVKKQCACIFHVRYNGEDAIVDRTEYINEAVFPKEESSDNKND